MIRTIFACCLALSFGAHPTTAQHMSTFNWGYLYAQKVVFDDSLDDLNGIGTWSHIDWDMGTHITPSVALVGGVGGFTAKNSFFFADDLSSVRGSIDVTTVSVPVHARVFLNDAAQTTRAFVDAGPSLNFQIYKVSFSLPGFDEEVNKKKLGALVGLGIVFGKKPWRFVVRTRYHWIDKHGEFDASNFQFTIGSVWGRCKKLSMTQGPIDNQHLERMPPQAIEMEQAVLGAMTLEQRAIVHAIEILDPSCFYNTTHHHRQAAQRPSLLGHLASEPEAGKAERWAGGAAAARWGFYEIKSWVLCFGAASEVLEPEELREAVRAALGLDDEGAT